MSELSTLFALFLSLLIGTVLGSVLARDIERLVLSSTAGRREQRRQAGQASYVLAKALGHSVMSGDTRPPLDQLAREAAQRIERR